MFFQKISIKDKALFYENVANLLEWGVTLVVALRGLRDRLDVGSLRESIDHLLFFVESGDAVNVAMRKLPDIFDDQEIAIVESGEQTGMIQESFYAIAKDLRDQEDLRNKITSAMTYPVIILFFLVLAITIVMMYVVPQLIPILESVSSEPPLMTRALISTSMFLKENIFFILLFLFAGTLILMGLARTEQGAFFWDREKILFPITWPVYKNYLVVRTLSTFYLLSSAWVSILKAMHLTGQSAGNIVIRKLYDGVVDDISHGGKISSAMTERDTEQVFFTPDIIQMIESAEKTSTISSVADKIAKQYRREVDYALGNMVKYIEPIALLLAWVFVLWFAIAIFGAIMQIVNIAGQ